eukprot:Awhi_evm1s8078
MYRESSSSELNSLIAEEIASSGLTVTRIDYGRKLEDSYPTNQNPPFLTSNVAHCPTVSVPFVDNSIAAKPADPCS